MLQEKEVKKRYNLILERAQRSKKGIPNEYQCGWLDALNWVREEIEDDQLDYEAGAIKKAYVPNL